jgi:hypothetical protein
LLIEKPGSITDFDLYDLKNPASPVSTTLSLPNGLLSSATTSESWQLVAWAADNQHVLLQHLYDGKSEYILVDIADPTQSVNLSNSLPIGGDQLSLDNLKYNSYYVYNPSSEQLGTTSLSSTTLTPLLSNVLVYKTYGTSTVLYATTDNAPKGQVSVKLQSGGQTYTIRSLPVSNTYLLNLTSYSGTLYLAVGVSSDSKVYVYQDPIGQISSYPGQALVPSWVLHVDQPNYLSFSDNAQFIMAENDNNYAVYDVENQVGYLYSDPKEPLDTPQPNASWMDGDRLVYVSHGKLIMEDYDNTNQQTLVSASSLYQPAFSSDYHYLITLSAAPTGQYNLELTPLLTPADI